MTATSPASSTAGRSTSPTFCARRREPPARRRSRSCASSRHSPSTTPSSPRLYLVTANAQPAPGTEPLNAVDQAAVWGLGRVIGHQEFAEYWGGLIDIDTATTQSRSCDNRRAHLRAPPRRRRRGSDRDPRRQRRSSRGLRPCSGLTKTVPHQAHRRRDLRRHRRSRSARPHRGRPTSPNAEHGTSRCWAEASSRRGAAGRRSTEDDPHFATVDHDPGDRTPRRPDRHAPVSMSPTASR